MRFRDWILLASGLAVGVSASLSNSGATPLFVLAALAVTIVTGALADRWSFRSFIPALATLVYVLPKRVLWELQARQDRVLVSVLVLLGVVLGGLFCCWWTGWLVRNTWLTRNRHPNS